MPVYRGCSRGLCYNGVKNDVIHGHDGLGGESQNYPLCKDSLKSGHAAQALVELINKHPGSSSRLYDIVMRFYIYVYLAARKVSRLYVFPIANMHV